LRIKLEKTGFSQVNFKAQLRGRLAGAEKTVIVGIGSELKGDDYAGVAVAKQLEKYLQLSEKRPDVKVLIGGNAPENLTGEIKRFKPSHILIIDCADLGKKAGAIGFIDPEKIGGASMDTHRLPIKMFARYLFSCIECRIIIIGIQPETLGFNLPVSVEVGKSISFISSAIKNIFKF
jgi:hydrogenase 3 maturation protease